MTAALSLQSGTGSRTDSNCGCREAIAQLQAGQARLEAGQAQIAAQLETLIALMNMNLRPVTDTVGLPGTGDVSAGEEHSLGQAARDVPLPSDEASSDEQPSDEQLSDKLSPDSDTQPSVLGDPEDPWSYHKETVPADVPVRLLPQFVQLANSDDPKDQLQGTLLIRKLLCVSENPPLDPVVASQIVPRLISFLHRDEFVDLQLEATWAVTNMASGGTTHTQYVMEQGAVPPFISLLNSSEEEMRKQATWALGNMSGESATCRNYILGHGVMAPLLQCITTPADDVSVLRKGVWVLSNLCRWKPSPNLDTVCQALPALVSLLAHDDEEVAANACWALAYISDGPPARVERVLDAGALLRVITLLNSPSVACQTPALRVVGNIAAGNDKQTELLVSSGALSSFHFLLQHPKRDIKKEACWALSNITAGTPEQIKAVIDEGLLPSVVTCIGAVEYEIKKEAVHCMANVAAGGTPEHLRYVVEDLNVLKELVLVLDIKTSKILKVALDALQKLLEAGEDEKKRRGLTQNPYAQMIIDQCYVSHIEDLERHNDGNIHLAAVAIVDTFFQERRRVVALRPRPL